MCARACAITVYTLVYTCSKLTMWKWSLNLKVGRKRSSPLDYIASGMNMNWSLQVQYSTVKALSTVQCNNVIHITQTPRDPHTYKERASEASSLLVLSMNKRRSPRNVLIIKFTLLSLDTNASLSSLNNRMAHSCCTNVRT